MERRTAEDQSPDLDLEQTREQIAEWRRTRHRRTRMPEDLWQRAADLARKHGLWATSQALRVRYENLKARMEPHPAVRSRNGTGFVELAAAPRPIAQSTTTIVELAHADGLRMTLRVPGVPDVHSLIESFTRVQR